MKTSNPYGMNLPVRMPPETITSETSKASSKAKARYPHKALTNQPGGGAGSHGSFKRALTPGTSPTGS